MTSEKRNKQVNSFEIYTMQASNRCNVEFLIVKSSDFCEGEGVWSNDTGQFDQTHLTLESSIESDNNNSIEIGLENIKTCWIGFMIYVYN